MSKQSTIAKLPPESPQEPQAPESAPVKKEELLKLINKGGRSARDESQGPLMRKFTLRIRDDLASRIEQAVKARDVRISSTGWITEAILEKLKREHF